MALLKKLIFVYSIFFPFSVFLQINQELKDAFFKSYHEEQLGLIEKATESLLAVYNEKNYEINYRLAGLYYRLKKHAQSVQYYKKAAVIKPKSNEAYWAMVQPLLALENFSSLNQCYLNILKNDSKNSIANYRVGLYYYYHKKYNTAKKYFLQVAYLYPSDFDALHMLTWSHYFLGNFESAKGYFNRALLIYPGNESVLSGLKLIK